MLRMLDLCCGLGGWSEAFSDRGYETIGIDIVDVGYPGRLVIADVKDIDGNQYRDMDVIMASPPCEDFSRHDQPWTRKRNPAPPDMSVVEACYRIKEEAAPRIFILENVRGAQKWLGKAIARRGPFYLWGDVPPLSKMDHLIPKKQTFNGSQKLERAKIPYILAYQIADYCKLSAPIGAN